MKKGLFEFAKGKFLNTKKLIQANIYEKDGGFRVAFDMDAASKEKATLYSDKFTSAEAATALIQQIDLD